MKDREGAANQRQAIRWGSETETLFTQAVLDEGVDRILGIDVSANRRRRRAHEGSKGPVSGGGLAWARLVSTQPSRSARKEGGGQ